MSENKTEKERQDKKRAALLQYIMYSKAEKAELVRQLLQTHTFEAVKSTIETLNAQGWTGSRAVLLWKRYCGHCVSRVVELARQVSSGERDPELINKQLNAWAAESENENPE